MKRRDLLRGAAALSVGAALGDLAVPALAQKKRTIKVLAWSERTEPAAVYPDGMHAVWKSFLEQDRRISVQLGNLTDPEQGVTEKILDEVDAVIWFGHTRHNRLEDSRAMMLVQHIKEKGLGFVPIHSSHWCKPFKLALSHSGDLGGGWKVDAGPSQLKVMDPSHPIAQGIKEFTIPQTEIYREPFRVSKPDSQILMEGWETGEEFRACNAWTVEKGRVVYFRPGHETYPIMHQKAVQQVITNCVLWAGRVI